MSDPIPTFTPASVDWVIPSVDNLEDTLVARAITAFRTKALGDTQIDPFDNTMVQVTTRIRGEIARQQVISLTENAIPPSLMWLACLMIVEAMQSRLPGVNLTDGQQKRLDDGIDYLKRINRGEVQVEYPSDPMLNPVIQTGGQMQIVTFTTKVSNRVQLAGL